MFVAETIPTSDLRTVHEQLHTGSARKCIRTLKLSFCALVLLAIKARPRLCSYTSCHVRQRIMLCRAVLRSVPCMNLNFPILRRNPLQGSRRYSTLSSFAQQPNTGQGRLILEDSTSHKVTRHIRWGFSGREIGPSQRLLPHHTKHLQQADLLATGGIRTGKQN
jgi:hypothetical protein